MTISSPPGDYTDLGEPVWTQTLHGVCWSAHSVSGYEPAPDPAQEVRKAAGEVPGKDLCLSRRRIGFL